MPVFACRWTNGDVSFVMAPSKQAAIEQLDEIANAEGCSITRVPEFQIHLRLTDEGRVDFDGWGELTGDFVRKTLYPKLYEAWATVWDEQEKGDDQTLEPEQQERIRRAVEEERERIRDKTVTAPQTETGRDIKRMVDMPTTLVDKIVGQVATERLENLKPRGRRH